MQASASPAPIQYHLHVDGGLYRLACLGKSSEGAGPVAIYEHLHPFERGMWSRPLAEFSGRFEPISDELAGQILRIPAMQLQQRVIAAKARRRAQEALDNPPEDPPLLHALGFMFAPAFDRVALIHKLTPRWQKGRLNGIGGKSEPAESSAQTMAREFLEEAGVATSDRDWTFFARIGAPEFVVHAFWCASPLIDSCQSLTAERVEILQISDPRIESLGISGLPALIHSALDPDAPFCRFDYRSWALAARDESTISRM